MADGPWSTRKAERREVPVEIAGGGVLWQYMADRKPHLAGPHSVTRGRSACESRAMKLF